jgi:hypothetical protein
MCVDLMRTTAPTPSFGSKMEVLRHRLLLTQTLLSPSTVSPTRSMAGSRVAVTVAAARAGAAVQDPHCLNTHRR